MSDAASVAQRSAAWYEARLGHLSASVMSKIMPGKRGSYPKSREDLMFKLLAERISGVVQNQFVSASMRWGIETEDLARAVYEATTGNMVKEVGFIVHPTIKNLGCSPDGIVGDDGGTEFKCPETLNLCRLMATDEIPAEYRFQVQTCLLCTGREWWDFMSFDPRMPEGFQYYKRRIKPDKLVMELIVHESKKFLAELDELETRVRSKKV